MQRIVMEVNIPTTGYDGSYQRQRRRSSPKKAAFHQNQCDDDVEVVDAKKGKRKTRAAEDDKTKDSRYSRYVFKPSDT